MAATSVVSTAHIAVEVTLVAAGAVRTPLPTQPLLTFAGSITTYCASIAITPSGRTCPPSITMLCPVM